MKPPQTETDVYIEALAGVLRPVQRIRSVRLVAGTVGLLALFVAGVAVALLGLRTNVLASPPLVGGVAGFLMLGVGGLVAALGASVPAVSAPCCFDTAPDR